MALDNNILKTEEINYVLSYRSVFSPVVGTSVLLQLQQTPSNGADIELDKLRLVYIRKGGRAVRKIYYPGVMLIIEWKIHDHRFYHRMHLKMHMVVKLVILK